VEQLSERLQTPISTAELERRWAAVRAAMERDKIDVLLMQNNNDHMGGYVKYFTDLPATNGYPLTAVFPRDDLMTLVSQGPFGGASNPAVAADGVRRGVKQWLTTPSYASCHYTAPYDAELAAKGLAPYAGGTIGLVGTYGMSYALVDTLQKGRFSNTRFVDAHDLVDNIKVIKSAEEQELIRRAAAMQDAQWAKVLQAVKPGMRDSEITALAQYEGELLGSEQGLFRCSSAPLGEPAILRGRHYQGRIMQRGDYMTLLIENNGPGGFYAELARTFVVGKASQELRDAFEVVKDAQKHTVGNLKPGALCPDIYASHNDYMKSRGAPPELRLYGHSQGYDLVERPLLRSDETIPLAADMCVAVHPVFPTKTNFVFICDNFLIHKDGAVEHIHKSEQKLYEV
jgi:Xaa-Pro aminopeptidase